MPPHTRWYGLPLWTGKIWKIINSSHCSKVVYNYFVYVFVFIFILPSKGESICLLSTMSDQARSSLECNPFVALFPSLNDAVQYKSQSIHPPSKDVKISKNEIQTKAKDAASSSVEMEEEEELDSKRILNSLMERVFLITILEC